VLEGEGAMTTVETLREKAKGIREYALEYAPQGSDKLLGMFDFASDLDHAARAVEITNQVCEVDYSDGEALHKLQDLARRWREDTP